MCIYIYIYLDIYIYIYIYMCHSYIGLKWWGEGSDRAAEGGSSTACSALRIAYVYNSTNITNRINIILQILQIVQMYSINIIVQILQIVWCVTKPKYTNTTAHCGCTALAQNTYTLRENLCCYPLKAIQPRFYNTWHIQCI